MRSGFGLEVRPDTDILWIDGLLCAEGAKEGREEE